jgi:hypothetical protein
MDMVFCSRTVGWQPLQCAAYYEPMNRSHRHRMTHDKEEGKDGRSNHHCHARNVYCCDECVWDIY